VKTQAQKWGNSLAIRIPSVFAREIGLSPGAHVYLQIKSDKLMITPRRKKQYTLRALLARVKKSNRHSETGWGRPAGQEAW